LGSELRAAHLLDAVTKAIITQREAKLLQGMEALRNRVIAVDDFDPEELRPNYMTAGHNTEAANQFSGR